MICFELSRTVYIIWMVFSHHTKFKLLNVTKITCHWQILLNYTLHTLLLNLRTGFIFVTLISCLAFGTL